MASQSMEEQYEAELAPSVRGEPASGVPSSSPTDLNLDSREVSDRPGDHAVSQDQGSQDNLQLEDQSQRVANVEDNTDLRGLSFPRKLWMIVENEAFKSVHWSDDGDTVIIEDDLFQREILRRRGAERIFETDSLKSFIRQLNLYGFSKIRPNNSSVHAPGNKRMMIYCNSNFQRDKPELLENIEKKGYLRNTALRASGAPALKRKKLVATRRSPRIHHNNAKKEANQKSQMGAPNVQGPSGTRSFTFSGVCSMNSISRYPQENCPAHEPYGPSGEGTSRNATFVPLATAPMEGTGEGAASPQVVADYGSVMSLYDTCYSILLAALSVMSPNEPPEEEPEVSADCKCALCEQLKDSPTP
ncbi:heat shock transcription factor, X-linked member 3-like [Eulemur rufifrons]|uniref:heat shock transcription factor, X-linked member 3-like n=1 Tax=Eulemur rufifrons TaxID=859984 RepID=UPI00374454D9